MTEVDGTTMIAAGIATSYVKEGDSLEDRFRAAMKAILDFGMLTNGELMIQAAVVAVYIKSTGEEKVRIQSEIDMLIALNAAVFGVPVDMATVLERMDPIGINKIWREVKKEHG